MLYKKYFFGKAPLRIIGDISSEKIYEFVMKKSNEKCVICFDVTSFNPENSYCNEIPPNFYDSVCKKILDENHLDYSKNMEIQINNAKILIISYPFCKKKSYSPLYDFYSEIVKNYSYVGVDFNKDDDVSKNFKHQAFSKLSKIILEVDNLINSNSNVFNTYLKTEFDNIFESLLNLFSKKRENFIEKLNEIFSKLGLLLNAQKILNLEPNKNKIIICTPEAYYEYLKILKS